MDGNVSPREIPSGGKELFTGDISELVSVNPNSFRIEILKDFDVEFIYIAGGLAYFGRTTVSKGIITASGNYSATYSSIITGTYPANEKIGIFKIYSGNSIDCIIGTLGSSGASDTATRITTNTLTASGSSAYYYRLYA